MAYINLNIYEEIEARELIDFVRSLDSKCASMSDEDLRMFIYEHINTLVLRYIRGRTWRCRMGRRNR